MATDWKKVRKEFKALKKSTYLNTAATGLIPYSLIDNVHQLYQEHAEEGAKAAERWAIEMENIRKNVADFIGASPEEIAIVPNMSIAVNWLALMLKPLKNIGFVENDFPSLKSPFDIHGFETKEIKLSKKGKLNIKAIEKINTHIFAMSHVQWQTGFKIDINTISKICKEKKQLFILDATQSLGTCNIDVKKNNVDILLASGYKWMMSGFGICIMYVKKEILEKYPSEYCWQYRAAFEGLNAFKNAKRFEIGHERHESFFRLNTSVNFIRKIGIKNIEKRVIKLKNYLYQKLKENNIAIVSNYASIHQSQIVIIEGGNKEQKKLEQQNIFVSNRGTGLRIAVHFYNNKKDIDRLIQGLKK